MFNNTKIETRIPDIRRISGVQSMGFQGFSEQFASTDYCNNRKNIYFMVATNVLTISGGAVVDAVAVADNSLGGVGFVADSGS